MNKKIIISLITISVVGIIAVGGTIAYFSDTETSSGNTFTAGAIDLKVDNECSYNGQSVQECTWEETDLDGHLFFSFSDIKPGDWGEDTISLHVHNNDAWACAAIRITKNDDNTCVDPEIEAEGSQNCDDGNTPDNDLFDGELAQNLNFFFWADVCKGKNYGGDNTDYPNAFPGDNIYQPECDIYLMEGPASDIIDGSVVYTLADSDENNVGGSGPLVGSTTYYIGKMWCFGTIKFDDDGNITGCDGSLVGNDSQTDVVQGDIQFYAVQKRNNDNFQCESWTPSW